MDDDIMIPTPEEDGSVVVQEAVFQTDTSPRSQPAAHVSSEHSSLMKQNEALPNPHCHNMAEHPSATIGRARLRDLLQRGGSSMDYCSNSSEHSLLSLYIKHGLAYTVGSALDCMPPPSKETCVEAYLVPNKAGLTAGARAWSKHAHRSGTNYEHSSSSTAQSLRWWGTPSGPVARINERAIELFWKVWSGATWRNLHWLPHQVLVYEVRVAEGYGMRWAQDRGRPSDMDGGFCKPKHEDSSASINSASRESDAGASEVRLADPTPWTFRGFVEPMMENGHEVGWRH
ncbi:hypothetical protein BC835DRAFT_572473 [Cytidiella melzeri]|nr:hypothetical protein BC835DRAFT_572473 [Cytidiella melzeri]